MERSRKGILDDQAYIFVNDNEDIEEVRGIFDEQQVGEIGSGVFDRRIDVFATKSGCRRD